MPATPPRMDREKLARVENGQVVLNHSDFNFGEDISSGVICEQINAAASAWRDREMKKTTLESIALVGQLIEKAVDAERAVLLPFVHHKTGCDAEGDCQCDCGLDDILKDRIRSAPGKGEFCSKHQVKHKSKDKYKSCSKEKSCKK